MKENVIGDHETSTMSTVFMQTMHYSSWRKSFPCHYPLSATPNLKSWKGRSQWGPTPIAWSDHSRVSKAKSSTSKLVIDMMYYVTTKDSDNKALITITHNSRPRRIPQLKLPLSGTYHEILFLSPLVSVHPKCCIKKLMQYNQPINMKERN